MRKTDVLKTRYIADMFWILELSSDLFFTKKKTTLTHLFLLLVLELTNNAYEKKCCIFLIEKKYWNLFMYKTLACYDKGKGQLKR